MHDDVDILNHHRITDIMCLIGVKPLRVASDERTRTSLAFSRFRTLPGIS